MELRFLGSYVEEYRADGAARFAAANACPFVIVRDLGGSHDEDDAAFQTKFMSRADIFSTAGGSGSLPLDTDGSLSVGHVIPVRKRAGGAFADRIGVGRAPNVDVRIPLSQVSKYHAYFSKGSDGRWCVTDAGSRNGTAVAGRRLTERMPEALEDGCDLSFGPYRLTFHSEAGFLEVVKRRAGVR